MHEQQFSHHPLLVLNNFGIEGMHVKLMATMFQNMFPSINVHKVIHSLWTMKCFSTCDASIVFWDLWCVQPADVVLLLVRRYEGLCMFWSFNYCFPAQPQQHKKMCAANLWSRVPRGGVSSLVSSLTWFSCLQFKGACDATSEHDFPMIVFKVNALMHLQTNAILWGFLQYPLTLSMFLLQ